jgi:hypothetical protein
VTEGRRSAARSAIIQDVLSALERIAYDSAVRALDKQEKVLEELRARTGILLGASSLTVSLLGATALDRPQSVALVILALGAFVASLGASLFVLLPREGFVFSLNGPEIYEELFEFRLDVAEIHRRLAYDLQRFWDGNDFLLAPVRRAFRLATWTLALEVMALLLLASDTL